MRRLIGIEDIDNVVFPYNKQNRGAFYSAINAFNHSEFFEAGKYKPITDLNQILKKKSSKFFNLGITSRGAHLKEKNPKLFNIRKKITENWSERVNSRLDTILVSNDKYQATQDFLKTPGFEDAKIMYIIGDDPMHINIFLENGIPSILIDFLGVRGTGLMDEYKQKYPDLFILVKNHHKAKYAALEIANSYVN